MCRKIFTTCIIVFMVVFASSFSLAENTSVEGSVKDSRTGDALFGANVVLLNTSMGAATDMYGKYSIQNVIAGTYTIRVSYIGYKVYEAKITIHTGKHQRQDFKLEPVSVENKEVVITAQAVGQNQAINQQLSSNQITNVVSAAKIQELPDANAAESVGRLPGVSVMRSGGEGNEVVIRGLAPKFNKITIDGIQMSSANASDRSTDLSLISSNMLEGIQVSKTITADMDADVIGGTVNFDLREAKVEVQGKPDVHLLMQGAYNGLDNAKNKLNNYKYVGSIENRFMDDNLGVFAQLDFERKNLSSNNMGASYDHKSESQIDYVTTGLSLSNVLRDRQRTNGALVLDYRIPDGKIKLTNFLSTGTTRTQSRQEGFDINNNAHSYALSSSKSKSSSINNALSYEQQISLFQVDAKVSHSYSETNNPEDWTVGFNQTSAGLDPLANLANLNPIIVPKTSNNDFSKTVLTSITTGGSFSKQRSFMGQMSVKTNVNFTDMISAEIKMGGKYRYQENYYNYDLYDGAGGGLNLGGAKFVDDMIISHFGLNLNTTSIPITYFTDPTYDYGKFIGGDYKMVSPLDYGKLLAMVNLMKNNVDYIAANKGSASYGHDLLQSTTNDYSGHESVSAFYLMSIINVGPTITIIPGVRYQGLRTEYTAPRGVQAIDSYKDYNYFDTTIVQNHNYWLPDVSLKYKPLEWFDVRLSYSNTISYPDYTAIIPKINVAPTAVVYNNYALNPTRSTNYDAYVSFYNNTLGLFTFGGFLKHITDMMYVKEMHLKGAAAAPYFPLSIKTPNASTVYYITMYMNNSYKVNNYGMELDWQTHFWYLPGPLSGLVFSANYTHIFSKTQYPWVVNRTNGRTVNYIDTSYTDRLIDQPDNIVNLSFGYDYKGFSMRISMLYQGNIFTGTSNWTQLRSHSESYTRWDLALKQDLPWYNLQLFADMNNINGVKDKSMINVGNVPTSEIDYGMLMDFGLRVSF